MTVSCSVTGPVTHLKGLPFFSKDNENGRNKKINDHKSHQDDTSEDQKGAEDRVESDNLGRQ